MNLQGVLKNSFHDFWEGLMSFFGKMFFIYLTFSKIHERLYFGTPCINYHRVSNKKKMLISEVVGISSLFNYGELKIKIASYSV